MNLDIIKNFSNHFVFEYAQFMEGYNSQMINLNSILDENNVTIEAKKLGREVLQSAIDFHQSKLKLYREEMMNEEVKQLMANDPTVYESVTSFENSLLESLEKSYADMLSFIRTYELVNAKTHRN